MAPVTRQDVERKIEEVAARLDQLHSERARIDSEEATLRRKRESYLDMMAEFFTEPDIQQRIDEPPQSQITADTYEGKQISIGASILRELPIADVAELVLDDDVWVTARRLFEILSARGKDCNYKAVRIALERNDKKRFEHRSTGAVIEWRKLPKQTSTRVVEAKRVVEQAPGGDDSAPLTIPDRAEAVIRTRGALYVNDLFAEMRSQGWKGTGNDHNDRNTLLSTLSTRKQRFKNLGGNVWDVVAASSNHAANGTLFTN